jgi:hypothetical protein
LIEDKEPPTFNVLCHLIDKLLENRLISIALLNEQFVKIFKEDWQQVDCFIFLSENLNDDLWLFLGNSIQSVQFDGSGEDEESETVPKHGRLSIAHVSGGAL